EQFEHRIVPAISVNLDQLSNGSPLPPTGAAWQNGDLNQNNSKYHEGSVVPFRFGIEGLTSGATDSIHINYDFTAGGHGAYDLLDSYDVTEAASIATAGGILGSGGGAASATIKNLVNNSTAAQILTIAFGGGSDSETISGAAAGKTVGGAITNA